MENTFYHDKLFLSEVIGLVLEARKKKAYLQAEIKEYTEVDEYRTQEAAFYTVLENRLLDVALTIHEQIEYEKEQTTNQ